MVSCQKIYFVICLNGVGFWLQIGVFMSGLFVGFFFVYLYNYIEYLMLDGVVKIMFMFVEVEWLGMFVVGMIDYGNMFGVSEFYNFVIKVGIKLIIGVEVYIVLGLWFDIWCILWGDFS